jgi:hypothetical protein
MLLISFSVQMEVEILSFSLPRSESPYLQVNPFSLLLAAKDLQPRSEANHLPRVRCKI